MSNKQTAVEWLEQINNHCKKYGRTIEQKDIEQAKEMEKEQHKNYLKEYIEWHKSMGFVSHKPEDIIEYNETYGDN